MKMKIKIGALALVGIVMVSGVAASAAGGQQDGHGEQRRQSSAHQYDINMGQAKKMALDHAGLTFTQVRITDCDRDWNDGQLKYEVCFQSGSTHYCYEIDASSGAILSQTQESAQDFNDDFNDDDNDDDNESTNGSTAGITMEEAKKVAAEYAGFSVSEVCFTDCERDWDDGRLEYELEFEQGKMEYECTVDGVTGDIMEFDVDQD